MKQTIPTADTTAQKQKRLEIVRVSVPLKLDLLKAESTMVMPPAVPSDDVDGAHRTVLSVPRSGYSSDS